MPIDFNQPTESQTVAGRNTTLREAQKALAQLLDPAVAGTLSNVPTGAYRLNAGVLERYNGTSWGTQSINGVTYSGGGPSVSVAWPIAMGGTGATTAAGARTALGSGATGDALFVATTAAAARTALGLGSAALQNDAVTTAGTQTITGPKTFQGGFAISGTAARVTADFSNATIANRAMFQTSTPNGATSIAALPNGTSTQSDFFACGGTDPANSPITVVRNTGAEAQVLATRAGTGAFVPFTVYVGGTEKLRQNINAQFGIQASPNAGWGASIPAWQLSNATTCYQTTGISVFANNIYNDGANAKLLTAAAGSSLVLNGNSATIKNYSSGSADSIISLIASFGLDGNGNATLTTASGGLGYGIGAGATVVQATSKTTSVTLNKPTGKITMHNAALAGGASVSFVVNNSLFNETDLVLPSPVNNSNYEVRGVNSTNGAFRLRVTNTTGGSLSEALQIQFSIYKGATS